MTKRLCFSYVRWSSPAQALGHTLRRQMDAAAAYAEQMGWELDTSLRDEGVSAYRGANVTKGALAGFLKEIEAGRVPKGSVLIVENLDRISRQHPLESFDVLRTLLAAGIEIVTLADRRHYSYELVRDQPMLLMGSLMILSRSNEESEIKAHRVSAAWANKRARLATKQDRPFTLKAPNWLAWNYEAKTWDLVPDRVAVVRRIFELTAEQRMGMTLIAKTLNAEGVPTLTGRTLNPGVCPGWQPTSVGQLLRSRTVLGELAPRTQTEPGRFKADAKTGVIKDYYPQIISFDLWNRAHAARDENTKSGSGRRDGRVGNVFRGRSFCAHCGHVIRIRYGGVASNGQRYNYYRCGAAERGAGHCTNRVWVDLDLLERGVLAAIRLRPNFAKATLGESEEARGLREQLAGLADEHARKVRRFATLGEMLADEESTSIRLAYRDLSRELDVWDTRRVELERQLAAAQGRGSIADLITEAAEVEALSVHEDPAIRTPARNRLMAAMGTLIGRIEIHEGRYSTVALADGSMRFRVTGDEVSHVTFHRDGLDWAMVDGTEEVLPMGHPQPAANSWPYRRSEG